MENQLGTRKIGSQDGKMSSYPNKVIEIDYCLNVLINNKGVNEAKNAGKLLLDKGFKFDLVYTSVLTRAITTYNYAATEMGTNYLPVIKSWRLNERHYGAL